MDGKSLILNRWDHITELQPFLGSKVCGTHGWREDFMEHRKDHALPYVCNHKGRTFTLTRVGRKQLNLLEEESGLIDGEREPMLHTRVHASTQGLLPTALYL